MAQAPSPRKTTTYKTFSTMDSQNERFGVEKDEFFFLENIMRVADGRLRSVMGPSSVVLDVNALGSFLELETGIFLLLESGTDDKVILNG